jgi:hypothetical protein
MHFWQLFDTIDRILLNTPASKSKDKMSTIPAHKITGTYFPSSLNYRMSPSLRRARMPFILGNIFVGSLVFGCVTGIYFYSMKKVKQEDFDDIILPTVEERKLMKTIEEEEEERKLNFKKTELTYGERKGKKVIESVRSEAFPSLIAWADFGREKESHFIREAPPIDDIGKVYDRRTNPGDRRLV